jgi:hypothetical protein
LQRRGACSGAKNHLLEAFQYQLHRVGMSALAYFCLFRPR